MEIVRQESQSAHLCPRGHVATICIRAFKGRRDVLVHLFRPEWTPQDDEDKRLAEYATQVMTLSKGIEDTIARYRVAESH